MARPFQRSSIEELEQRFSVSRGDLVVLSTLAEELRRRSTNRARRLRGAVEQKLSELMQLSPEAPSMESEPSETEHANEEIPESGGQLSHVEVKEDAVPPSQTKHPPTSDAPSDILSSWIAFEVLSPPAFSRPEQLAGGNRNAVAAIGRGALPWERGERSRPKYRLYYQVVLGTIKMERALARLVERFGDTRPDFPPSKGGAILATVVVDQQGRLVDPGAVAVSSFGWGVPAALKGSLLDLAQWPKVELDLVRRVEKELLRFGQAGSDETRRGTPLTYEAILSAHDAIMRETGLPPEMVEPPHFAIRSYEHFKNPNPPEPLLLNSFFLADLSNARSLVREKKAPDNLRRYLGSLVPERRTDLLQDRRALETAIAPSLTGLSRWPGPGRPSLSLLQQAAVNLAFSETRTGGMIGVNGPPGTGKTTLLRDVLAGVVTQRAEAMMRFDDPEDAFRYSGLRIRTGNAWLSLHRLDPALRGFEIVVASSNNKAVENVSREIPALGSIDEGMSDLRHFKSLSDKVHGRKTWGLIAAVLGNSANRWSFKESFWWDDEVSMNVYLQAATGTVPQVTRKSETGTAELATPTIVAEEKPPHGHDEALLRWNEARKRFKSAFEASRKWQVWLEGIREDMLRLDGLIAAEVSALDMRSTTLIALQSARECLDASKLRLEASSALLAREEEQVATHRTTRPGFWARVWRTERARKWSQTDSSLRRSLAEARAIDGRHSEDLRKAEDACQGAAKDADEAGAALGFAKAARSETEGRLNEARERHGVALPDAAFFARTHAERQQANLWLPKEAQHARDALFVAAMDLHHAFVDAAAKPLRNNLGVLMSAFSGSAPASADKEALLPDLWASLFLVVPLVSTTFASVGRMFGRLPAKSIGWLLVDEAGQAVPQAAVGSILRAQRVVVVGDPAQIEPVVTLPDALIEAISRSFGVDPDIYSAPAASVQTLADAASSFSSEFQTRTGTRTVGVPLLVHRRCAEPMFGISNSIAYSGLMVQAKPQRDSAIRRTLGPSRWIHVEGTGEDKWCEEEGTEVLRLLSQLVEAGIEPDLYVVSPFVIVAERLRELVRESGVLRGAVEEGEVWRWAAERIGTVHTVQGREAEAVIVVLGAAKASQSGARGWAGGRPNVLNVAVTRAKEAIYVVGNRRLWREAGHFAELDRLIR